MIAWSICAVLALMLAGAVAALVFAVRTARESWNELERLRGARVRVHSDNLMLFDMSIVQLLAWSDVLHGPMRPSVPMGDADITLDVRL